MRKLFVAAWLAASSLLAAVPASADSPVSLPPLAVGEVLVETNAIGIVRSPATSATISATISAEGATEAEARRAVAAAVQRLTAAARTAGVAAADISVGAVTASSDSYATLNTVDVMDNAASTMSEMHYASSAVSIRVRNAAAAGRLQGSLDAIDNVSAGLPQYALDDDAVARRDARSEAIRRARTDAESYAAALNMRVGRVLRVTERTGLDFLGMALSESNTAMRTFRDYERTMAEGEVLTFVVVGVDFAMTAR